MSTHQWRYEYRFGFRYMSMTFDDDVKHQEKTRCSREIFPRVGARSSEVIFNMTLRNEDTGLLGDD